MNINMSLNKSYFSRNFHLVLMVVLGGILFYIFLVSPHLSHIMAAEKYQEVASVLEDKNDLLTKVVANKHKQLQNLQAEIANINQNIFDDAQAKVFLNGFESKAKELGCGLDSVHFMPLTEACELSNDNSLIIYKAVLNVKGKFGNIARYIASLQKNEKRVWINSVSIDNGGDPNGYLEGTITVTIHVVQDKESIHNEK